MDDATAVVFAPDGTLVTGDTNNAVGMCRLPG